MADDAAEVKISTPPVTPDRPSTPHEAAIAYANRGWRVVPIQPGRKYPGLEEWQIHATTDLGIVHNWWTNLYRGHGVGIATGPASGCWVLDVDTSHDKPGIESLDKLEGEHGRLPATVTARTGGGGWHYFFAWRSDRAEVRNIQGPGSVRLGPGLDVRGEGGQVVAAPTVHPETKDLYRWAEGCAPWEIPLAPAPDWLHDLLEAQPETTETPATPERRQLAAPSTGQHLTSDEDSIARWANEYYSWADVLGADGWTAMSGGKPDEQFWCRPGKHPKDGKSAVLHLPNGPLVVFTTDCHELHQYGKPTKDRSGSSLALFGYLAATRYGGDRSAAARAFREQRNGIEGRPSSNGTAASAGAGLALPPSRDHVAMLADGIAGELLSVDEIIAMPDPVPLVESWLDRNSIIELFGPYGSGKSFLALDLALSVATGTPWLGHATQQAPVLFIAAEGAGTMKDRVAAWCQRHAASPPKADFALLPRAVPLVDAAEVDALVALASQRRWGLVVIDTLARSSAGADENSGADMALIVDALDRIRRATDAAVAAVHHAGHSDSKRGRGHSSFEAAMDVIIRAEGKPSTGIVVTSMKQKFRADPPPFGARFVPGAGPVLERIDAPETTARTGKTAEAKRLVTAAARGLASIDRADLIERATARADDEIEDGRLDSPPSARTFKRAIAELIDTGHLELATASQRGPLRLSRKVTGGAR